MNINDLVGKKHEFGDGCSIKVVQIKHREDELGNTIPYVTYEIQQGPRSLPRKLISKESEFMGNYGHLFK